MASIQNPFIQDIWRSLNLSMQSLIIQIQAGEVDVEQTCLVPLMKDLLDKVNGLLLTPSQDKTLFRSQSLCPVSKALLKKEEELERIYKYRFTELELRTKELKDAFDSVARYSETVRLHSSPHKAEAECTAQAERDLVLAKLAYEVERDIQEVTSKELETFKELLALKEHKPEQPPKHCLIASAIDCWSSALLTQSKPRIALSLGFYKWRLRTSQTVTLRRAYKKCPTWADQLWRRYRTDLLLKREDPVLFFNRATKQLYCRRIAWTLKSALSIFRLRSTQAKRTILQRWSTPKNDKLKVILARGESNMSFEKKSAVQHWRLWSCNLELYLTKLELMGDFEG
jgi:hypothetical protein